VDVVSGAASQIFFFFFPQNPADVDGDQLDVSEASLGSTMLEKKFFSRARESSRVSGQFRVNIVVKKKFSRTRKIFFSHTRESSL